MALTALQRRICALIARNRVESGESYVAGGVALNLLIPSGRLSRDIDLFHDTESAVASSFEADSRLLAAAGHSLRTLRERPGFVEALVGLGGESVVMQWARDSAFRFFPLVEHAELGLALHPFDLATNKLLAAVGRVEARDWVDLVHCHQELQPLGYLAWAACGKDSGFNPRSILAEVRRTARYSATELAQIDFAGAPPSLERISRAWRDALAGAEAIVEILPPETAGACVLDSTSALYRADAARLGPDVAAGKLRYHHGTIRGSLPSIRPAE